MRKLPTKKKPERRFKGTEDAAHLERVRALPCLLRGKRCTITRWKGAYPNAREVLETYQHECIGYVEAHHVVSKARGGRDLGETVPLCGNAHRILHTIGQSAFEAMWSLDLGAVASQLAPTPEQDGKE